ASLDALAAFQRDRCRRDPVDDELAPAAACCASAELLHARSVEHCPSPSGTPASSGGGRRRNDATASRSSAASADTTGSARATAASPACHSRPLRPWKGRTQTTRPLATKNPRREPSSAPG